jgi:sigma-B regulation protein RsbU (phosphoserine phosphatase)
MLQGAHAPLGVSEQEVYTQVSFPFAVGDLFVFYSDGVTEAQNEVGEFFGADRLVELIRANSRLTPEQVVDRVRQAVIAFSRAEAFADDVTCVAVKITDTREVPPVPHTG